MRRRWNRWAWLPFLLLPAAAWGSDRFVVADGLWNEPATWGSACGGAGGEAIPSSSDVVHLCPGVTVQVPCGVNPSYEAMVDEPGDWTHGGLVIDGSACEPGAVPRVSVAGTELGHYLDDAGSEAAFVLRGRSVARGVPFGFPSDLTATPCGTAHGIPYGPDQCATYSWAGAPHASAAPAIARLAPGQILWFTSGQWRNNFVTVLHATPISVTLAFGDPADQKGQLGLGPTARDVASVTWATANPRRIEARLPSGTLPGTGQLLGSCLVMEASGSFYRIAHSVDGGVGEDSVFLDPWAEVATADAAGGPAWIAPCIRPGDRFDAFEPVVVEPVTPGVHIAGFGFMRGLCPVLERAHFPNLTGPRVFPASGLSLNLFNYAETEDCTVEGPVAVGPVRDPVGGDSGYGVGIWRGERLTLRRHSFQGFHRSEGQFHGFRPMDTEDLVIEDANVSYANNEAFWTNSSPTDADDSEFEGVTMTLRRFTAHDVFQAPGTTDPAGGIHTAASNQRGIHSLEIQDAVIWNVENPVALSLGDEPGSGALFYDSVVAYPHLVAEGTWSPEFFQKFAVRCAASASDAEVSMANVALLTNERVNGAVSAQTRFCRNIRYAYVGQASIGVMFGNAVGSEAARLEGLLVQGGGPTGPVGDAIQLRRVANASSPTLRVRDVVVRDWCFGIGAPLLRGIAETGTASDPYRLSLAHVTLGLYCSASAASPLNPASAGLSFSQGLANLLPGSQIRDALLAVGDPTQGGDVYEMFAARLASPPVPGAGNLSIDRVLCSECARSAAQCQLPCLRDADSAGYAVGQTLQDFGGAVTLLGFESESDLRLLPGSPAYQGGGDHMGARYAGLLHDSPALRDFGVPLGFASYRADPADVPDLSGLPDAVTEPDEDGDEVPDATDACVSVPDLAQLDGDGDGIGDACDLCATKSDPTQSDLDFDGFGDVCDAECGFGTTRILGLQPASAIVGGTVSLTVAGAGPAAAVRIGGVPAEVTPFEGMMLVRVPAIENGLHRVELVNPEGCSAQEEVMLSVTPPPPPSCGLLGPEAVLLAAASRRWRRRSARRP